MDRDCIRELRESVREVNVFLSCDRGRDLFAELSEREVAAIWALMRNRNADPLASLPATTISQMWDVFTRREADGEAARGGTNESLEQSTVRKETERLATLSEAPSDPRLTRRERSRERFGQSPRRTETRRLESSSERPTARRSTRRGRSSASYSASAERSRTERFEALGEEFRSAVSTRSRHGAVQPGHSGSKRKRTTENEVLENSFGPPQDKVLASIEQSRPDKIVETGSSSKRPRMSGRKSVPVSANMSASRHTTVVSNGDVTEHWVERVVRDTRLLTAGEVGKTGAKYESSRTLPKARLVALAKWSQRYDEKDKEIAQPRLSSFFKGQTLNKRCLSEQMNSREASVWEHGLGFACKRCVNMRRPCCQSPCEWAAVLPQYGREGDARWDYWDWD